MDNDTWKALEASIPSKVTTADVWKNMNKLPSKKSRQLEAAGTNPPDFGGCSAKTAETAGEEDTLMGRLAKRMASRDYIDKQNLGMGTKANKAATADTADDTMQNIINSAPGKMSLGGYDPEGLKTGRKIEKEHKPTVEKIKDSKIKTPEEVYDSIAKDHLKEHPKYYDKEKGLPAMEKKLTKESASMEDNHLIKQKYEDMESITPYWEKMKQIRGKDLDTSGYDAYKANKLNATPGAPAGDYSNTKTELVMPGSNMADQAKNTGRVIGKGLGNFADLL